MNLSKILAGLAAVLAVSATAHAQPLFTFTFDSGTQDFWGAGWTATGPAGWSGGAAIQQTSTSAGWTLGSSIGHEFSWTLGQQVPMQSLAASGNGRISFDLIVDGTSFAPGISDWYSMNIAGNSDGAAGWTQVENLGSGWHNADDNTLVASHVDLSFAQVGWEAGDNWFQVYFGSNSGASPVKYYLDNVSCYAVPEPSAFALAGLGAAALLVIRRRQ